MPRDELTYALITPYSLRKSRTGGIIGRLLVLSDIELVAARMFVPSDAFVDDWREVYEGQDIDPALKKTLLDYADENLRPNNALGITNRALVLLFSGRNVSETIRRDVLGEEGKVPGGETVRGAFVDLIRFPDGGIKYFEPAVLTSTHPEANYRQLEILSKYAMSDGGVHERVVTFPEEVTPETTLVILKPDNFAKRSSRPGNIIDRFSRTGLYIVGAKVLRMSVAQGEEFYGPLRTIFIEKLKGHVVDHLRDSVAEHFEFSMPDEVYEKMADFLKDTYAECEFNKIVDYMTGIDPASVASEWERRQPGTQKSMALLYQGEDAISKIRAILGTTAPEQAEPGTVRSDFGISLMRNAAHASDSPQDAARERTIVGLTGDETECEFKGIIDAHLAGEPLPITGGQGR